MCPTGGKKVWHSDKIDIYTENKSKQQLSLTVDTIPRNTFDLCISELQESRLSFEATAGQVRLACWKTHRNPQVKLAGPCFQCCQSGGCCGAHHLFFPRCTVNTGYFSNLGLPSADNIALLQTSERAMPPLVLLGDDCDEQGEVWRQFFDRERHRWTKRDRLEINGTKKGWGPARGYFHGFPTSCAVSRLAWV